MPKNNSKVILYTKSSIDECCKRIEGLIDMVERPFLEEISGLLGHSRANGRLRGHITRSGFWIGRLRRVHIKGNYFRPVFKAKFTPDEQGGTRIEGYSNAGFVTKTVHIALAALLAIPTVPGFISGVTKVGSGNLKTGLPYVIAMPIAWICFGALLKLANRLDHRDQAVLVEYVRRKLQAERVSVWRW